MARSRLRRISGARKALLRSLVTSLFQYGRITTTEAKAKELRHVADKMITLLREAICMLVVRLKLTSWIKLLQRNCLTKSLRIIPNAMAAIPALSK